MQWQFAQLRIMDNKARASVARWYRNTFIAHLEQHPQHPTLFVSRRCVTLHQICPECKHKTFRFPLRTEYAELLARYGPSAFKTVNPETADLRRLQRAGTVYCYIEIALDRREMLADLCYLCPDDVSCHECSTGAPTHICIECGRREFQDRMLYISKEQARATMRNSAFTEPVRMVCLEQCAELCPRCFGHPMSKRVGTTCPVCKAFNVSEMFRKRKAEAAAIASDSKKKMKKQKKA